MANFIFNVIKGRRKKKFFISGPATKRGGGLNECATKEKITFF